MFCRGYERINVYIRSVTHVLSVVLNEALRGDNFTNSLNHNCRSRTTVFYYKVQHFSPVHISHHQVGKCRIHIRKHKGREAYLYSVMNYNNIIPNNGITRLKLMHSYVTELICAFVRVI